MRPITFRKHFLSKDAPLLVIGIFLLLAAGIIHQKIQKPLIQISKQDTALNVNKNLLIFMSAGNRRLFSDLIWIQTLLESDLERYSNRDLNNWLYLRFITIQALDPDFYENYLYGGQFLAIVKDDLEGANVLYAKGVARFPDDYELNFQAGFMNFFEVGDFKTALKYLTKIENHPKAPVFLPSIINKLKYGLNNDLEATFQLVLINYQTTKDKRLKDRLWKDLYSIRAEIDLNCLNQGHANCKYKDLSGVNYIKNGGTYRAPQEILKYGIKTRTMINPPPSEEKK
jgi:hypothetical protein